MHDRRDLIIIYEKEKNGGSEMVTWRYTRKRPQEASV